jgi:hypothetical protein
LYPGGAGRARQKGRTPPVVGTLAAERVKDVLAVLPKVG